MNSKALGWLSILTEIAALGHDLGKGTVAFALRLAAATRGDDSPRETLRHELVSALLLVDALALGGDALAKPAGVAQAFESAAAGLERRYARLIRSWIEGADERAPLVSDVLDGLLGAAQWKSRPETSSIVWLALSHHLLPGGEALAPSRGRRGAGGARIACDLSGHVCRNADLTLAESLRFADATQPWQDARWTAAMADAFVRLRSACDRMGGIGGVDLARAHWLPAALFSLARPALIWSDYLGSADKCAYEGDNTAGEVFANTIRVKGGARMADTLTTHLLRVGAHLKDVFPGLCGRGRPLIRALPSLGREARPAELDRGSRAARSPYAWQQRAVDALAGWRDGTDGAFVGIIAGTGSGKTVASARIAHQISSSLRLSVGLGLRTLTAQTHRKWTAAPLGFARDEVALLVGTPALSDEAADEGSDNRADEALAGTTVGGAGAIPDCALARMIGRAQERSIVSTPIQIMTIDHLVRVAAMIRGGDTRLLWHVMSSDLILDEIDDYRPGDLVALGQLVQLYGLHGRKVILSSATLSPIIFGALYRAWRSGYRHYRRLHPAAKAPRVALVSDSAPYARTLRRTDEASAARAWRGFVARRARAIGATRLRHRMATLAVASEGCGSPRWGDIWSGALALHRTPGNRSVDPATGIRLSAGFVRLNRVDDAQALARWIAAADDDGRVGVKLVCYHARHTLLDRTRHERFLDRAMARGGRRDPLPNHAAVRAALDAAAARGQRDLIIIVCTTSIIETGRDHDYDWAILEPSTTRSLVQAAGRVWRHRRAKRGSGPNILLLERPLNAMRAEPLTWAYPGIETPTRPNAPAPYRLFTRQSESVGRRLDALGIRGASGGEASRPITHAVQALPRALLEDGISPIHCLRPPRTYASAPLTALEFLSVADALDRPDAASRPDLCASLSARWSRSDALLTGFLARHWHWRDGGGDEVDVHVDTGGDTAAAHWRVRSAGASGELDVRPAAEGHPDRWLIAADPAAEAPDLAARLGVGETSAAFRRQALGVRVRANLVRRPRLGFGHQLGFCAER